MKHSKVWRHLAQVAYIVALTVVSFFSLTAAAIAICASILVVLHDKAGSLIELSFGPLKAKLERNVSEAEKLVMQLREFAVLQARSLVSASVKGGRMGGSAGWAYDSAKSAEAALRDLGVPPDKAKAIQVDLVRYAVLDLGRTILGYELPLHLNLEGSTEFHSLQQRGFDTSPNELEAFLNKWNMMTPAREQRLADMRWIIEHDDIRDRDQMLRSQEPD
jgi:hypothetical protein